MFPKIDLHCHLDGSLSIGTIRELARTSHIELPDSDAELEKMLTAPPDCASTAQYLECFDLPCACLQTAENLFEAARSVVVAAAADDVIYMEIRFAPLLHTLRGLSVEEIVRSVVDGVRRGSAEVNASASAAPAASEETGVAGQVTGAQDLAGRRRIEVGVILCGMRHMPVAENVEMLKMAAKFFGQGVCGVDIAGDETDHPPMEQKAFFDLANALGIPITIHAGECGSAQNVLDAVSLGARRIGHGIALMRDAAARRVVRERGVTLEMCPTSNLQTGEVGTWENYPFRMFMDEGLRVTVNTDNRTVSSTTMAQEFSKLERHCKMTAADKEKILQNSIDAAFAPEAVKAALRAYACAAGMP